MAYRASLRQQLLTYMSLLMLAFTLAAGLMIFREALKYSNQAYDQWLLDSANSLAQLMQPQPGYFSVPSPAEQHRLLNVTFAGAKHVAFRIDDAQGLLMGDPDFVLPKRDKPLWYGETHYRGHAMRAIQLRRQDQRGYTIWISLAEDHFARQERNQQLLMTTGLLSIISMLVTVLLVRYSLNYSLRPLARLTELLQAAPRASPERAPSLQPIALPDLPRELAVLAEAINLLLSQLQTLLQRQQQFVANAAHQMQTPVAALKMELELVLREQRPEYREQAAVQLQDGMNRLSRLLHQLLILSRAEDTTLFQEQAVPVDLATLAEQVMQLTIRRPAAQNHDLGLEVEARPVILGQPSLLEEVLSNLLDNALKYTPADGEITLRVSQTGQFARIEVEDNGPGVPNEALSQLGRRFYRVPGLTQTGSGLGMAIVQDIVHLHQGQLHIRNREPQGLLIELLFPLHQS